MLPQLVDHKGHARGQQTWIQGEEAMQQELVLKESDLEVEQRVLQPELPP